MYTVLIAVRIRKGPHDFDDYSLRPLDHSAMPEIRNAKVE